MSAAIAELPFEETMTFDHVRLARVCDRHARDAEAHLASVLTRVETLVREAGTQRGDAAALRRTCSDLRDLAGSIGMITMERAAAAVCDSAASDDARALGACHARLLRLGNPGRTRGWALGRATHPDGAA